MTASPSRDADERYPGVAPTITNDPPQELYDLVVTPFRVEPT